MIKAILATAASLNAFVLIVEDGSLDMGHSGNNRWLTHLSEMDITHLLGQRPSVLATMRALGLETKHLPTKACPTYGLQRQVKSTLRFVNASSLPETVGDEGEPPSKVARVVGATPKMSGNGKRGQINIPPPPPVKEAPVAAKKKPTRPIKPLVPKGTAGATSSQAVPIAPWRSSQASLRPPSLQDLSDRGTENVVEERRVLAKTKLRLASRNQREVISVIDNDKEEMKM
eukprot:4008986-Amphidinium_carterae.2